MAASTKRRGPAHCLTRAILATSLALIGGAAIAQINYAGAPAAAPGYATDSGGRAVTNPFGLCWKTGSWTPALAEEPCDSVPRAAAYVPPVAAAPEPAPAPVAPPPPEPTAIVEPPRPVIEKVSLETDVLFEFGKAELRPAANARRWAARARRTASWSPACSPTGGSKSRCSASAPPRARRGPRAPERAAPARHRAPAPGSRRFRGA